MISLLYIATCLAVIGLAFWAYRENYATQQALDETADLHSEIRAAHARLAVLRAEWAYQNRPDRLRALAELNFDRLGLVPFRAEQFGQVDQIPYPQTRLITAETPFEYTSGDPVQETRP